MPSKKQRRNAAKKRKRTFTKFIAAFKESVELQATEINKEIARSYANDAKDIIEGQLYNWKPLSKRYLKRKLEKGYDTRIYVRSGEFLASIGWGVTHGKVWAGIPSRKMYTFKYERADEPPKQPFPMHKLARWLEYGTKIIPARPIWRPLLAKYIRNRRAFAASYRKGISKTMKQKIRIKRK